MEHVPCARHHAGDVCGAKMDVVHILLEPALLDSHGIRYKSYRILPINSGAASNAESQLSGRKMSEVSEPGTTGPRNHGNKGVSSSSFCFAILVWLHFMVEKH